MYTLQPQGTPYNPKVHVTTPRYTLQPQGTPYNPKAHATVPKQ